MLHNEYILAKISFDTAENKASKILTAEELFFFSFILHQILPLGAARCIQRADDERLRACFKEVHELREVSRGKPDR